MISVTRTKPSRKCDYYLRLEGLGAERSEKEDGDPRQLFGATGDGVWTDS